MAWLLLGGIGLGGATYLLSEAKDWLDTQTKPLYDYIETEKIDANERQLEILRQTQIERKQNLQNKHNNIRLKYNLNVKLYIILKNDTNSKIDVIYINHHLSEKDCTITWAKKKINNGILDGDYLNLSKIIIKQLDINCNLNIIKNEMDEYNIILHKNNKYVRLECTESPFSTGAGSPSSTDEGKIKLSNLF